MAVPNDYETFNQAQMRQNPTKNPSMYNRSLIGDQQQQQQPTSTLRGGQFHSSERRMLGPGAAADRGSGYQDIHEDGT